MKYFESHAHYDDKRFKEDREELLGELLPASGVSHVINIGCDVKSSEMSIRLADKYDYIYAAVGVHPHELYDMSSQTIAKLKKLSEHPKVVAIGEIGLDYYYDTHPRELQRFWFRQQLRLAEEVNKPVIIHSREASQETFDIIQSTNIRRGSIHCYSGSAQMAQDYVKMGFHIGVGGVVTFSNAKKLVETVEAIPIESILIETDCPYLAPNPNRGKRNDSTNLKYIVEKIAEIKKMTPEDVAKITENNAKSLFFK
ncbi:MAG: TatD family hydrolase [Bacteroidales bacterium]|nr:TatD family hydrolase [Anaerotignum sp.]MCI5679377.1 TatD family hydrolase [Bacteroidales bacterium]MDY3927477.1 TatD family hydrolase [Anaerotignum sp.]